MLIEVDQHGATRTGFSHLCRWGARSLLVLFLFLAGLARAQENLLDLEDLAIRSAVDQVAPSVVRIETYGGLERVGKTLVGEGPTTGVVLSPDGWIVSSAFNFVKQPNAILVSFPHGERIAARIVAWDQSRMLVLLKVDTQTTLAVPKAVPRNEMQVGQTSIAVGRALDANRPNLSVGILSAKNRIWGKAIQTDAKVSPSSYGGPLVDIRGRVLGILVPLSPNAEGEMAGTEWYDSGIGFAIPLEDIQRQLPRWQAGKDLLPGLLGVGFEGESIYTTTAKVAVVHVKSPAEEAGLQVGDTIVEVDGLPIQRQSQLKHALGTRYAGDEIHLVVSRDGERLTKTAKLTDVLVPYEHPFLGILPTRRSSAEGVVVRYVYSESAAAKANIHIGDRIVTLAGKPIADAKQMRIAIANATTGEALRIGVERATGHVDLEVVLTGLPTVVPSEVPAVPPKNPPPAQPKPETGFVEISIPEEPNQCVAWVPKNYDSTTPYGVLVCLPIPGEFDREQFRKQWEEVCRKRAFIALAPLPSRDDAWQPTEVGFVRKSLEQVLRRFSVDRTRVIAMGHEAGGAMAYLTTFRNRDLFRGVAVVDSVVPFSMQIPNNDPLHRFAIHAVLAKESPSFLFGKATLMALRAKRYPVTLREEKTSIQPLTGAALDELVRWIDSLDRI